MTGVETTIAVANAANTITKEHQKGFIQYCLVSFFNIKYKKYLTQSILVQAESQFEAKQEIIEKFSSQPTPALQLMESEGEVDYKNMAGVLMKAADKIDENAEGNIDPDKIKRLKDLSKEFSSEEMQDCISSILAGEYNSPGTFSLQTMDIVRTISKVELEIFSRFKEIILSGSFTFANIFSSYEHMSKLGVSVDDLSIMESLGLISSHELSKTLQLLNEGQKMRFEICGKFLDVSYDGEKSLGGLYFLTRAGKELYPLVKGKISDEKINYMKELFLEKGLK